MAPREDTVAASPVAGRRSGPRRLPCGGLRLHPPWIEPGRRRRRLGVRWLTGRGGGCEARNGRAAAARSRFLHSEDASSWYLIQAAETVPPPGSDASEPISVPIPSSRFGLQIFLPRRRGQTD